MTPLQKAKKLRQTHFTFAAFDETLKWDGKQFTISWTSPVYGDVRHEQLDWLSVRRMLKDKYLR